MLLTWCRGVCRHGAAVTCWMKRATHGKRSNPHLLSAEACQFHATQQSKFCPPSTETGLCGLPTGQRHRGAGQESKDAHLHASVALSCSVSEDAVAVALFLSACPNTLILGRGFGQVGASSTSDRELPDTLDLSLLTNRAVHTSSMVLHLTPLFCLYHAVQLEVIQHCTIAFSVTTKTRPSDPSTDRHTPQRIPLDHNSSAQSTCSN